MKNDTAKNFVLQLGSLISLYLSLAFLITLLFSLINLKFPDEALGYFELESASASVRLGIAMVVVFFPTYLILVRLVNNTRRKSQNGEYTNVTRWLIYLSLLFSSLVLLGDLVSVIMAFLNGEITARFIYKALIVMTVIGFALFYYVMDARGYWLKNESKSIVVGVLASIIVFVSIVFGFSKIETPAEVREMKLDEKQIMDLQSIQTQVINKYILSSSTLPTTLEDAFNGLDQPAAPEGRTAYTYSITESGYKLCAEFSHASPNQINPYIVSGDPEAGIKNPDNWNYKSGNYCFERVVKK